MTCDRANQIYAYYDGELPAEQRQAVEAHLRECTQCRELLAQLQALSSLFVSARLEPMPGGAIERLEAAWDSAQDRAILRISSWLTAAAAAVLVGAIMFVPKESSAVTTEAPGVWQEVAVNTPVEQRDSARAESVVLAQWMADEVSARGERQ
jgi:anti-sigma factor RsiW